MAIQGTGTPPKTKRSGIFPDSIRKAVIISSFIALLIIAVFGAIGIWNNWGIAFNLIFLILAVVSVVFGLLALWPSNRSAESPANPGPESSPKFENNIHIHFPDNHQPFPIEDKASVDSGNHGQSPRPAQYAATGSTPVHHIPVDDSGMTTNEFRNASRGAKLQLKGRERADLRDILFQAFPDQIEFDDMLQIEFDKQLNGLVNINQNYEQILFDLIKKTQSDGWTERLITAAYKTKPGNEALENFYLTYVQNREAQTIVETARANTPASPLTNRPASQPSSQDNNLNNSGYTNGVSLAKSPSLPSPTPGLSAQADPPAIRPLSPIEQARVDVKEAQSHVKQADELFSPGKSASPEKFREARSHLTQVKELTLHLQKLLKTNGFLSEPLKSKKADILAQMNVVFEQIDKLLYSLRGGIQSDSRTLKEALSKIQQFISD